MQLDLDTNVLKVRDQSNKAALTDQYPDINILTKESREKLENRELDKNRRYDELINNLTFSVNNEQLPKELVRLKMSELNIFTSKADYYNLTYKNEKTISPVFSIIFLIFMGSVGLLFALNRGKRRKYAH
ncbi:hypothetical protein HMPREF9970_1848 [Lachnoanaerobaculum saburreum F0468]|jgi:hypothetical protein|uniref:Uncharacterized protein n=1 Tax=Lachnoanaerobaculum saburreum F0468 TaxID=1095750 RepID=I0R442_9FIRM|nr:hypothetical protein [Lachnoanaerobaculum saburreum]EIC94450.1 hypothetical protein HMPREF9970_1848 [Lachnoanaerobaculum saburreum F0468]